MRGSHYPQYQALRRHLRGPHRHCQYLLLLDQLEYDHLQDTIKHLTMAKQLQLQSQIGENLPHITLAAAEPEPTLQQALNGPDAIEWQEAIDEKRKHNSLSLCSSHETRTKRREAQASCTSQIWQQLELNATLRDDIYMRAPPGYLKPGEEGKVLKLLRSLYGN